MNLIHNWNASFIDASQRIILTKPGRNRTRRIYMHYGGPHDLKRIDAHGGVLTDGINPVPPSTRSQLLRICGDRWP